LVRLVNAFRVFFNNCENKFRKNLNHMICKNVSTMKSSKRMEYGNYPAWDDNSIKSESKK